jgi:chromosome segregation ATPase
MTDLVERLRDTRIDGAWYLRIEAATALEAKDKEIEALRHEIRALQGDVERHTAVGIELSGENTALNARAETTERKLDEARAVLKRILNPWAGDPLEAALEDARAIMED